MSEVWASRQRRTNQLVRAVAAHIFQGDPEGDQLLGLCRLTWITSAYDGENAAYIRSTKIPALAEALGINFDGLTLAEVAECVSDELRDPAVKELVLSHTGFTNFYKAFRNSARPWASQNRQALLDIFRGAQNLASDAQAEELALLIADLPPIPKANHPDQGMKPDFLVTPACFALDPRLRFPIMNGAGRVHKLLQKIGASDGTVLSKHRAMVRLIGRGGVKDAADLDQLGLADQADLLSPTENALRHLLGEQPELGDELPSKEELEIARLQLAGLLEQRRLHNQMTNRLRHIWCRFTLLEGHAPDCRYDVLVRDYDGEKNDLLIEVKSSIDASQVRMAIGQVFAYWHRLKGEEVEVHAAILLPSRPDTAIEALLVWLGIGLLWFNGDELRTQTSWLSCVANFSEVG